MTSVASLKLCKKLYELSGWRTCDFIWIDLNDSQPFEMYAKSFPSISTNDYRDLGEIETDWLPAYDLEYILKKLPHIGDDDDWAIHLWQDDDEWYCGYYNRHMDSDLQTESTCHKNPADAACELAINLFERHVLIKEDSRI